MEVSSSRPLGSRYFSTPYNGPAGCTPGGRNVAFHKYWKRYTWYLIQFTLFFWCTSVPVPAKGAQRWKILQKLKQFSMMFPLFWWSQQHPSIPCPQGWRLSWQVGCPHPGRRLLAAAWLFSCWIWNWKAVAKKMIEIGTASIVGSSKLDMVTCSFSVRGLNWFSHSPLQGLLLRTRFLRTTIRLLPIAFAMVSRTRWGEQNAGNSCRSSMDCWHLCIIYIYIVYKYA